MVDVLRADPGATGLVTAVSGMLTKVGASLWSVEPRPLVLDDVSAAVHEVTATVEVDERFAGEVTVEAATVAHGREGPTATIVLGRTADGRRAVATGPGADAPPRRGEAVAVVAARLVAT
jgi:acetyl-CoA C-acetyltransferase